jgi:hypothetical protein
MTLGFWFIIVVMAINLSSGAVGIEITEFESNPEDEDSGEEWIELYSEEEFNLEGYSLRNQDDDIYNLSGNFSGYFVVTFDVQWLDNSDERVYLLDENNETVDRTSVFDDNDNDNFAWSLCDDEWVFLVSSEGEENNCEDIDDNDSEEDENNETVSDDDADNGEPDDNSVSDNSVSNLNQEVSNLERPAVVREKIVLNPPIVEVSENPEEVFISKQERLRRNVVYAFLVFAVVLIVLLALRRL